MPKNPSRAVADEVKAEKAIVAGQFVVHGDFYQGSSKQRDPEATTESRQRVSLARLPLTGSELVGRANELRQLSKAWADPGTNIITVAAWGGAGKSALVNRWLARIASDGYRGAERVFAWSFYNQGSSDRIGTTDQFIDSALRWFEDDDPAKGSPWDKGERLARLINKHRTLLVLDGLEPLQEPPNPIAGRLKDPGVAALLRSLVAQHNGLCVITTRYPVADIEYSHGSTLTLIELEGLTIRAGAKLLRILGVQGTEQELRDATAAFRGHALAVTLMGTYLRDVCAGDVRRLHEVDLIDEDEEHGSHARRMMASYKNWFAQGAELDILHLVGLFNRPVDGATIAALRTHPPIASLTTTICELGDRRWKRAVGRLRRAKLLLKADPNDVEGIDAHPLVREYFGRELREVSIHAWRSGHDRIYEHLKTAVKELPDTFDEMMQLFLAVVHGCEAGRHQDAVNEVLWPRIFRDGAFYSTRTFGGSMAEFSLCECFFTEPWKEVHPNLGEEWHFQLFNCTGTYLRMFGRLSEAITLKRRAVDVSVSHEAWIDASTAASSLADHLVLIGDLAEAITTARQAIVLARRAESPIHVAMAQKSLVNALLQTGRTRDADELFQEIHPVIDEVKQAEPFWYAFVVQLYCDLLLELRNHDRVLEIAKTAISWAEHSNRFPLAIAFGHLSLGRAQLQLALQQEAPDFDAASNALAIAVKGLRQAGHQDELPRGLLARAALSRVKGDLEAAQIDLNEARKVVERSSMKLFDVDCKLEEAQLLVASNREDQASAVLQAAWSTAEEMGYHRRDPDFAELERKCKPSQPR